MISSPWNSNFMLLQMLGLRAPLSNHCCNSYSLESTRACCALTAVHPTVCARAGLMMFHVLPARVLSCCLCSLSPLPSPRRPPLDLNNLCLVPPSTTPPPPTTTTTTTTDHEPLRAHLVQVSIDGMHQNGRDTHVRLIKVRALRAAGSEISLSSFITSLPQTAHRIRPFVRPSAPPVPSVQSAHPSFFSPVHSSIHLPSASPLVVARGSRSFSFVFARARSPLKTLSWRVGTSRAQGRAADGACLSSLPGMVWCVQHNTTGCRSTARGRNR